ncbi:MAG: SCO family protein [Planktomarina sp.]
MSAPKIAAIASGVLLAIIGGTYAFTEMRKPANRFEACTTGGVAGGNIGGPFELVNHLGDTVTDVDVLAEPSLVYFGYTFCPDVCPVDVSRNSVAVDILAETGRSVTPVFITIDPTRDTPEYLFDFVTNNHPKMIGLTGTQEQIAKAARAYKAYYRKQDGDDPEYYLMDHSTFTYLMMPGHGFVDFLRNDLDPEQMADRVACFIDAA